MTTPIKVAQNERDGGILGARQVRHVAQPAPEPNPPHTRPVGIGLHRRHDGSIDCTESELEAIPDEFVAPKAVSGFKRAKKRAWRPLWCVHDRPAASKLGGHIASTSQAASSAFRKPSARVCACPAGVAVATRTHSLTETPSFSFVASRRLVLVRFMCL